MSSLLIKSLYLHTQKTFYDELTSHFKQHNLKYSEMIDDQNGIYMTYEPSFGSFWSSIDKLIVP